MSFGVTGVNSTVPPGAAPRNACAESSCDVAVSYDAAVMPARRQRPMQDRDMPRSRLRRCVVFAPTARITCRPRQQRGGVIPQPRRQRAVASTHAARSTCAPHQQWDGVPHQQQGWDMPRSRRQRCVVFAPTARITCRSRQQQDEAVPQPPASVVASTPRTRIACATNSTASTLVVKLTCPAMPGGAAAAAPVGQGNPLHAPLLAQQ